MTTRPRPKKKAPPPTKMKEPPKPPPAKKPCAVCGQLITVLTNGDLRQHTNPETREHCLGGRTPKDSSIEEKARRYVSEGRVTLRYLVSGHALAEVQGSKDEPYQVRYWQSAWVCSCEAQVWHCAHVAAVFLVADPTKAVEVDTELDRVLDGEPVVVGEGEVADLITGEVTTTPPNPDVPIGIMATADGPVTGTAVDLPTFIPPTESVDDILALLDDPLPRTTPEPDHPADGPP